MAGFWTSAAFTWLWAMPGLPFGLSSTDYNQAVISILLLNALAFVTGGSALVLRARASRSGRFWRRMALHDPLTGLANRTLLNRCLVEAERSENSGVHTALLFLDLDYFKEVNDEYGHAVGDKILIALADRLSRSLGPDSLIARYGGDEFVILLFGAVDMNSAEALAQRLLSEIADPFRTDGMQIRISASIGAAISSGAGPSLTELINVADRAAYQAKAAGKGRYVITNADGSLAVAA